MDNTIDLYTYFERISFTGEAKTDISTLKRLHLLHTQAIPFENLNPLLKIPVNIEPHAIYEKMVTHRRGGYCYEQNILFQHVLQQIGFEVTPIAARVLLNRADDEITARTHMLLFIRHQGTAYIADVGFGGQGLTGPLIMEPGMRQETPLEDYRIIARADHYLLQIDIKGEWKTLYRFETAPQYFIDYVVSNWYVSTHPNSSFTNSLTVARTGDHCRYTLHNNRFSIHRLDGKPSERQVLTTSNAIQDVLEQTFNLELPKTGNLSAILKNLSAIRYDQ